MAIDEPRKGNAGSTSDPLDPHSPLAAKSDNPGANAEMPRR